MNLLGPFRRNASACAVTTIALVALLAPSGDAALPAQHRAATRADAGRPFFDARVGGSHGAAVPSGTAAAQSRLRRALGREGLVQVDPTTGTPRVVQRANGALTAPSSDTPRSVALGYVRSNAQAFGLTTADIDSLKLAGQQLTTGDGVTHLRWEQSYDGIPAFDDGLQASVDRGGRLINVVGAPRHDLSVPSTTPQLSAADALRALQQDVGVTRDETVADGPSGPTRRTTFASGDRAALVLFGAGDVDLAWNITYRASLSAVYEGVVDATTGAVLHLENLAKSVSNSSVWENYPGAAAGGTAATVDLAPYLSTTTKLQGPNAHVWTDKNDNGSADAGEDIGPSSGTNFTYPLTSFAGTGCASSHLCSWDPGTPSSYTTNRQQSGTQLFWFINNFHDWLTRPSIGFDAASGNFEGNDPVQGFNDDGASFLGTGPGCNYLDNSYFAALPDGQPSYLVTFLFLYDPAGNICGFGSPFRNVNGADDAAIVYHEYTHGLSSRLITNSDGSGALNSPQAGAMGEAWSDWYAQDYLERHGLVTDNAATPGEVDMGEYTDVTAHTIRTQALDCPIGASGSVCPGGSTSHTGGYTYGDFGSISGFGPEVHADGEIWGETLWDLRTRLISELGETAGSDAAETLITGAMRLSPPEPSMLDMRNAILAEDVAADGGAHHDAIWDVFAARGMGWNAAAFGSGDVKPVEDFSPPPAAGAPTGTVTGTVTDAATGAPVSGARAGFAGHDTDTSPAFGETSAVGTTDANGHYSFSLPAGSYRELQIVATGGYDAGQVAGPIVVPPGGSVTQDVSVNRDWAAPASGGAVAVSDDTGAPAGCGGAALVDQSLLNGWSPFNPTSTRADNPRSGSPTAVFTLPKPIDISAFAVDPAATCGDDGSATTRDYRIETSTDGSTFKVAKTGSFTVSDGGHLNVLAPAANGSAIKAVRLTLLSPQSTLSGLSGADFIDFSEFEVYGKPSTAPAPTPPPLVTAPVVTPPVVIKPAEPPNQTVKITLPKSGKKGKAVFTVKFSVGGTVRAKLNLTRKLAKKLRVRTTIGSMRRTVRDHRSHALTVAVSNTYLKTLKHRHVRSLKVTIVVIAVTADGHSHHVSKLITLKL